MKLLHIDSSILGAQSASREIGAAWVQAWRERHPSAEIVHRDLARDPLAHLNGEIFAARLAPDAPQAPALQPAVAMDFQETYLRAVLGCIGVTDVQVIRAEGLSHGGAARASALAAAHVAI